MKHPPLLIPLFALLAVAVALLISYCPPPSNGPELWALVSGFLGFVVRDLTHIVPTLISPAADPVPAAPIAPTTEGVSQ